MADDRLKRRGKKYTAVVWRTNEHGDYKQQRLSYDSATHTKAQAQKKFTADLARIEAGGFVTPTAMTFRDYVTAWLRSSRGDYAPTTWQRFEQMARVHVIPVLGRYRLQDLRAAHLNRAYAQWREAGLSPQTVVHHHRMIHRILAQAKREQVVTENFAAIAQKPRTSRREMRFLTTEEIARLADVASSSVLGPIIGFALATGARRGELLGLKWDDVDFDRGTVAIRRSLEQTKDGGVREKTPKSGKSRVVMPPADALDSLRRYRARLGRIDPYVFPHPIDGGPWTPHKITDGFREIARKAGLVAPKARATTRAGRRATPSRKRGPSRRGGDVTFHTLRHTSASLLCAAGVHPKVVQEMLGHSSIAITMDLYSHTTSSLQADASTRLGDALRGPLAQLRASGE